MAGNVGRWVRRSAPSVTPTSADVLRWVWRRVVSNVVTGKLCAHITMTAPGATFAMTAPSASFAMTTPGATIELEDCT